MKTLLFLIVLAAVGVPWALDRIAAAHLRVELAAVREENTGLGAARREHAQLREQQEEAARRGSERRDFQRDDSPAVPPANHADARLIVGEWRAPATWHNRGHATPVATIETALWAAGGGDLAALKNLLRLDESVRTQAEALRAQLPEAARTTYGSAEHLLVAFAAKALPLGDAQLVWNHQPDANAAWACLFVKNPEPTPPAPAVASVQPGDKVPPMGAPTSAIRALYLVLHRNEDAGWRISVSPGAVEKIAKEIRGSK